MNTDSKNSNHQQKIVRDVVEKMEKKKCKTNVVKEL
jgi:hypothetical protein